MSTALLRTCALVLLSAALGLSQSAKYQVTKVRFRVLDADNKPLEDADLLIRPDSDNSNRPPDNILAARSGGADIQYRLDDPNFVLAGHRTAGDGVTEIPFVTYSEKTDGIPYLLWVKYRDQRTNYLPVKERSRAISSQDADQIFELHADLHPTPQPSHWLYTLVVWIAGSILAYLLCVRAAYPSLIRSGWAKQATRTLCTISAICISFLFLFLACYWWMPYSTLFAAALIGIVLIWLAALVFTMPAARRG